MRKEIHGQNHVTLERTNRQSHITRGSKEIKIQMFSFIFCESSFGSFYSRTEQNLKWASICLWEGASIFPSCARQRIFSLQPKDPARHSSLFSFKQKVKGEWWRKEHNTNTSNSHSPVKGRLPRHLANLGVPKKSQGNAADEQPSVGKADEKTSTNA